VAKTEGRVLAPTIERIRALALLVAAQLSAQNGRDADVTRATLDNELRVVLIRDPLAPVVTVEDNYLAGADETPSGFPGTAHAQEHMAFRGCAEEVGITRFDPDYYALQLGNHVLGGGLYHDLRQETGYVYTITYGSDPQNVVKARDLIARDLRAMQTDNVPPQQLHQAKALLLRQMPLGESSEEAVAGGLLALRRSVCRSTSRHTPPRSISR